MLGTLFRISSEIVAEDRILSKRALRVVQWHPEQLVALAGSLRKRQRQVLLFQLSFKGVSRTCLLKGGGGGDSNRFHSSLPYKGNLGPPAVPFYPFFGGGFLY